MTTRSQMHPCACGCGELANPGRRFAPRGHDTKLRERVQKEIVDASTKPDMDAIFPANHPAWEIDGRRITVTNACDSYTIPYIKGLRVPEDGVYVRNRG